LDAVDEGQVEGKIKTIFEDIRATLGVPTVGLVFRQLAGRPWFLDLAWRNLRPNAETEYFHRVAGELKVSAESAAGFASGGTPSLTAAVEDGVAFSNAAISLSDTQAKLLLATAALRAGINGQLPRMNLLSMEEKRVHKPALPGSGLPQAPSPTGMQESLLREIGETLRLGSDQSELRALLVWPVTLANAWSKIKDQLCRHLDHALGLGRQAESAVEALPYRLEISSTACRQSGLTEDQIDVIKWTINGAFDSAPRVLLTLAALQVSTALSEVSVPAAS